MKPKSIESIKEIKYVYRVTYEDGSTGIIEVEPTRLRPIINGEMCNRCRTGIEHCLYIQFKEPAYDTCPILTIQED
jgi:hypothetical protein